MSGCPKCGRGVEWAGMEVHLRECFHYPVLKCALCAVKFYSDEAAALHFRGRNSKHHGQEPDLVEMLNAVKEETIGRILDAFPPSQRTAAIQPLSGAALCAGSETPESRRPLVSKASFSMTPTMPTTPLSSTPPAMPLPSPPIHSPAPKLPSPRRPKVEEVESDAALVPDEVEPLSADESEPVVPEDIQSEAEESEGETPQGPLSTVKCRLCPAWVKDAQRERLSHVTTKHLRQTSFACLRCDYVTQSWCKSSILSHARNAHALATIRIAQHYRDLRPDNRQFAARLYADCFGVRKTLLVTRGKKHQVQCRLCEAMMTEQWFRSHIVSKHLREPAYSCKRCSYTSLLWMAAQGIGPHVIKHHGATKEEASGFYTDSRPNLKEKVAKMLTQCFGLAPGRRSHPPLTAS